MVTEPDRAVVMLWTAGQTQKGPGLAEPQSSSRQGLGAPSFWHLGASASKELQGWPWMWLLQILCGDRL